MPVMSSAAPKHQPQPPAPKANPKWHSAIIGPQAVGPQAVGPQAIGPQAIGPPALNQASVGPQIINQAAKNGMYGSLVKPELGHVAVVPKANARSLSASQSPRGMHINQSLRSPSQTANGRSPRISPAPR